MFKKKKNAGAFDDSPSPEAPMPRTTAESGLPNYEGTVRGRKYEVVEVEKADIDYLTSKSTTAPTYPIGDDEVDVYAVDTRIWDRMAELLDGSGGDAGPHTHNNYADKTHDHPPQDLTHNHNGVYQPAGSYAQATHDHANKADKTHTHDMSHNHSEYADKDTLAQHLANHPSGGDGGSYDDTELRGLIAGNTDALDDKSDKTHTHDTTHNHDSQYQAKGNYALDTHTHDTTHNHNGVYSLTTHLHDENYQPKGDYATKTELTNGLAGKAGTSHPHDYADKNHAHNSWGYWRGSQEEYDALDFYEPTILYAVVS